MNMRVFTLCCAILATSCATDASQHPQKTPPGSFLRFRAATVNELLYQVNRDPVVRNRYARHFRINPQEVGLYFRKLILIALRRAQRAPCWYLDKHGHSHLKLKYFPKGSLVFASTDNKPVLSWSCGNPLGKYPFPVRKKLAGQPTPMATNVKQLPLLDNKKSHSALKQQPVETKVLPNPVEVITAEPPPNRAEPVAQAATGPAQEPVAANVQPSVVALAQAPEAAAVVGEQAAAGFGGIPYIAGFAGLLGGIAVFGNAHGDDSGGSAVPPAPEVPEPPALAVLGIATLLGCAAATIKHRGA